MVLVVDDGLTEVKVIGAGLVASVLSCAGTMRAGGTQPTRTARFSKSETVVPLIVIQEV